MGELGLWVLQTQFLTIKSDIFMLTTSLWLHSSIATFPSMCFRFSLAGCRCNALASA